MLTVASTELWIAFVAASAVMLAIPGPTILTVIAYAMTHGRKVTLPLVCAVALGDATALAVSLVGLGYRVNRSLQLSSYRLQYKQSLLIVDPLPQRNVL